jgi:hypothetical protein
MNQDFAAPSHNTHFTVTDEVSDDMRFASLYDTNIPSCFVTFLHLAIMNANEKAKEQNSSIKSNSICILQELLQRGAKVDQSDVTSFLVVNIPGSYIWKVFTGSYVDFCVFLKVHPNTYYKVDQAQQMDNII